KPMIVVPLFDLKSLYEIAATAVGTSNRRHQARLQARLDRIDDGVITGAAAVIAGKKDADLLAAAGFALLEQFGGRDHHARRAVAALERIAFHKLGLQIGDLPRFRQPLDGDDVGTLGLHGEHEAAANDGAVDAHRAGPANPMLATDM